MELEKDAQLEAGTLYDINKQLSSQEEPMSKSQIAKKQEEIRIWCNNYIDEYAMLLCHEQRDYTVFAVVESAAAMSEILIECLENRGTIISIDPVDGHAWEIWLRIMDAEGAAADFVYYLFPYDEAVIVC